MATTFDQANYTPGDPWPTLEYATRAYVPPRIFVEGASAGGDGDPVEGENCTPHSYFEFRRGIHGDSQHVEVSIQFDGSAEVLLQRSRDDGDTWYTIKTYDEPIEEYTDYHFPEMLRLLVSSGSGVQLGLYQQHA